MVPQIGQIYRYTGVSGDDARVNNGDLVTVLKIKERRARGWMISDITFLHDGRSITFELPSVHRYPDAWLGLFEEVG